MEHDGNVDLYEEKSLGDLQEALAVRNTDYATLRDAVETILGVIDGARIGQLRETPDRVARMLLELSRKDELAVTRFPNEGYDQMIVQDHIAFFSLCEHHLVPFFGTAKVAYIPGDYIAGLSKLARSVEYFAKGLQTQERITNQVADFLFQELEPKGVGVTLRAEHLCMSMRGVRQPEARTLTVALRGVFKDSPTRDEFLG